MIDRTFVLNLCQISSDINEYLMSLYNVPVQNNSKNIVEIGTGVSTFALVAAANKIDGKVTTIDTCGGDALNRVQDGEALMKEESRLTIIKGDSRDVVKTWKDSIDFLFLDSEHTYELTLAEILLWFPYMKSRGVVMMHDTGAESGQQMQCRQALEEWYKAHKHQFVMVHLMDTKIIGLSILIKL